MIILRVQKVVMHFILHFEASNLSQYGRLRGNTDGRFLSMLNKDPAMALEGMGPILPYYWNKIVQINFQTGDSLGLTYIICFLSILTMIVLFFLAALIIKARSKAPENRFMAILLFAEGYYRLPFNTRKFVCNTEVNCVG